LVLTRHGRSREDRTRLFIRRRLSKGVAESPVNNPEKHRKFSPIYYPRKRLDYQPKDGKNSRRIATGYLKQILYKIILFKTIISKSRPTDRKSVFAFLSSKIGLLFTNSLLVLKPVFTK
jgi:hypothetical protein